MRRLVSPEHEERFRRILADFEQRPGGDFADPGDPAAASSEDVERTFRLWSFGRMSLSSFVISLSDAIVIIERAAQQVCDVEGCELELE
jgi:hypothetical protein